jgi:uncharacterized phiE125 gp8 family phage protein
MKQIDPRRVKITTPPAEEPVTTSEAKLQAHIDQSVEDALIAYWIETARQQCEDIARRAFVTRTYTAYLDCWPGWLIELPYPPLATVTSVKYYDDAGSPAATFASSNYFVDTHSEPGRLALKSSADWPSTTLRDINGVEIIYTAGYGAKAAVPARYKAAIFLIVAHLYQHRESVVVEQGVSLVELPQGIYDLLLMDRG